MWQRLNERSLEFFDVVSVIGTNIFHFMVVQLCLLSFMQQTKIHSWRYLTTGFYRVFFWMRRRRSSWEEKRMIDPPHRSVACTNAKTRWVLEYWMPVHARWELTLASMFQVGRVNAERINDRKVNGLYANRESLVCFNIGCFSLKAKRIEKIF